MCAGEENYERTQFDGVGERDRGDRLQRADGMPGGLVYVSDGQKHERDEAAAAPCMTSGSTLSTGLDSGNVVERQFSNTTVLSEKSSVTVNHDPSKHSTSPITVITTPDVSSGNPFDDRNTFFRGAEDVGSLGVPKIGHRSRDRGDLLSADSAHGNVSDAASSARVSSGVSSAQETSRKTSRSSDNLSRYILETPPTARRKLIRSQALERFKASAAAHGLEVLEPSRGNFPNSVCGMSYLEAPADAYN